MALVAKRELACFFLMMMIMAFSGACMAATYIVGDSAGWTIQIPVDYTKWSSTNNFHVGDKIVTHQNFQSCNATSPIASYTSGSDSITLKSPGNFYYLCGVPGHCQAGQKVPIKVIRASARSPSLAPSESALSGSPSAFIAPSPSPSSAPIIQSSKFWLAVTALAFYLIG
ncbi:mavicyanin-like isoform X2 [Quercus lobata]|uniref:mavicyanin-like isoform X2 n=1 Tax=Quercus lobata TaxID=97700 RepID=UPI0012489C5A|nr:mavicyanin-like isoform X2 [Quercus lobata]